MLRVRGYQGQAHLTQSRRGGEWEKEAGMRQSKGQSGKRMDERGGNKRRREGRQG